LIVILFGIAGNLLQGRGLPPLSISITPLNDIGVYALIVFQHLFLVCSLYYFVSNVTDRPMSRVLCAAFFALTPWMYVYANCIGSEAFSNPLIVLVAALGWNCLDAELGTRNLVPTDALEGLNRSLSQGDEWKNMFLFYRIDETLVRSGMKDMQLRTWQIDLKLNRIALAVLCSMEPHYLGAVWSDFMQAPLFSQSDLAYSPFILTDWLGTQLVHPRYGRLRGLASFQHEPGYYDALWRRTSYLHLFGGVPMVWMAGAAVALGLVGLTLAPAKGLAGRRTSYSAALVALGLMMVLGSCLTTFSAARFNLPAYSLFQMAMIFGGLAATAGLTERLETLRKTR
jgi:hypothetical protein